MTKLIKHKIVAPAWEIIKDDTQIKLFYIFPGLLSVIFLTAILVYQSIYTYVEIFNIKDQILVRLLDFLHSGYAIEAIIASIVFIVIYFISIPVFEGGLIKYIEKKDEGVKLDWSDFLGVGFYKFLQLFKFNNIFSEFKFIAVLNAYLFLIRFVGVEFIKPISYLFLVLFLISSIFNLFLSYAKYELIIGNKSVFKSVSGSAKITVLNLITTIKLYFLMLILNVRVIMNFILFLFFPLAIITTIGAIASQIFLLIAIIILSILFISLILILGYMTAVLEVFKTSLWYYAYKEGKKNISKIKAED